MEPCSVRRGDRSFEKQRRISALNAYEVLRDIHPIGSQIRGVVSDCTDVQMLHGVPSGCATLATSSQFRSVLPYQHLVDDVSALNPVLIPKIGDSLETVVFDFVDDTLYLSAKPHDLKSETIAEWADYYAHIATLSVGGQVTGLVQRAMPFGLFVDIGLPYVGLIDIGHTAFNSGRRLPHDNAAWPKVGDQIRCSVGYFRFHNRQIGLGWLPK
jgi:ribosomal protein S1